LHSLPERLKLTVSTSINPLILLLSATLLAAMNPSSMAHSHDFSTPFSLSMPHMQFKSVAPQGPQGSIVIIAVLVVDANRHPVFFHGG
jgi:hypothetical protein